MSDLEDLKIALVTDWLTNRGGGERVFLLLAEMFPEASIYTSVFLPEIFPELEKRKIHTSFLQHWPLHSKHQLFPTLRPKAFERFDLDDFDIVISAGSAEAKGVITRPETFHLCYCFTPTRYYWSGYHFYMQNRQYGILDPLVKMFLPSVISRLRLWDRAAADRVDQFIAISDFVAKRIKKYYQREAAVLFPPVQVERFEPAGEIGNYFLIVGRQVPYKRTDVAVQAFNRLRLPLKVVGEGSALPGLLKMAGSTIEFMGELKDQEVAYLMARCRALIFPQEEDFGIVPLEAQASGRPVIAYGGGGARETVKNGETGLFFYEQTPESLVAAVEKFEEMSFNTSKIRSHALKFKGSVFKTKFKKLLLTGYRKYRMSLGLTPRV